MTLIADSDDEFMPETFKTFYDIWNSFTKEERDRCGEIAVLCQDQFGNRVGCDFPIEKKLLKTKDILLKHRSLPLGETWAALKTENLKFGFLNIPKEAKGLKMIPESFFWEKITFGLDTYSYILNRVLRIYYRNDGDI